MYNVSLLGSRPSFYVVCLFACLGVWQADHCCILHIPLQHLKDYLDLSMSALRYIMSCYPEEKDEEQMRRSLGRYGLTGKQQVKD